MKSRFEGKDQGGVASFVIIGAVLVVLLAGGLYLSKHQARINHESGVQVTTSSTTSDTSSPETKPSTSSSQSTSPSDSSSQSTPQQATPSTNTAPDSTTDTTAIASTGPTETIVGLIVTSGIAFTLYRLFLSRKHLHRIALTTK